MIRVLARSFLVLSMLAGGVVSAAPAHHAHKTVASSANKHAKGHHKAKTKTARKRAARPHRTHAK